MKRIAIAVCVVVSVLAVTAWAQTPVQPKGENVEQKLIALENEWADASVRHDWAFLERMLADDYVQSNWDGTLVTKAEVLVSDKSGEYVVTSAVNDEMKDRVYGDAAVVTGRWTAKETFKGKDTSGQYRWTDTWINKAARWQCVASHNSKIVQK